MCFENIYYVPAFCPVPVGTIPDTALTLLGLADLRNAERGDTSTQQEMYIYRWT